MSRPKSFRYSLNEKIRRAANWILDLVTPRSKENRLDLNIDRVQQILLVRANFRMGDSYFVQLRNQEMEVGEVVRTGCLLRLRLVLMTATVTVLGLLPLLVSTGVG